MQITELPTEALKPYERNPRRNAGAVSRVAESIREFGWRQPIVADEDNVVLVGHTRLLAAKQLGLEQVPVHIAAGLTEAQKRAYRLADNRLNEYAKWDDSLLAVELQELKALGLDLHLTAFSERELRKFAPEDLTEPADPEAPEPRAAAGDLWALGDHRLLVGDSTDEANVATLFGDCSPILMVTDPPYGVRYDPTWRATTGLNAQLDRKAISNDDVVDWHRALRLFPGDSMYVWHAGVYAHTVAEGILSLGFDIRAQIVWVKPSIVVGRGNYHWQHEPCWYAVRKGRTAHWTGSRGESTVWQIASESFISKHPTQKPVEAMGRPIQNNSAAGDVVYDPFVGTGTTIVAAERLGRRCVAMEIDPQFADVAIARWEQETGLEARKP